MHNGALENVSRPDPRFRWGAWRLGTRGELSGGAPGVAGSWASGPVLLRLLLKVPMLHPGTCMLNLVWHTCLGTGGPHQLFKNLRLSWHPHPPPPSHRKFWIECLKAWERHLMKISWKHRQSCGRRPGHLLPLSVLARVFHCARIFSWIKFLEFYGKQWIHVSEIHRWDTFQRRSTLYF